MKIFKLLLNIGIVFSLLFSINFSVYAHTSTGTSEDLPIEGIAPKDGYKNEPLGKLTGKERKLLLEKVSTEHISFYMHQHYFDGIYNTYDGYHDRGEVASGYNGKTESDVLEFGITRSVSNSWSTSIGFEKDVVTAGVGYNVTWSDEKSWTYYATVSPDSTAHIGYQDWYHVSQYNVHTTYVDSGGYYTWDENGTGWSAQWFKPHFYSWETPGNTP